MANPSHIPRDNRQIVLCFDGTNNNLTGGVSDTNVVKLTKLLSPAPGRQLVYYDPGVGDSGSIPGVGIWAQTRVKMERLWGLALGKGVYENIAEAYIYLMRNWHADDDIFVFGFSRGAFTARSLAGMVARFGILSPSMEGMVPTLVHLYFSKADTGHWQYKAILRQIGETFCSPPGAAVRIWFVGVWDTVESVGSPLSRSRIPVAGTIVGKRFHHVRQALALDEHRRNFEPRPYYIHPTHDYAADGQSIEQLWWSGAHCDVGGGYEEAEAELSDGALVWMLEEALQKGLHLRTALVRADGTLDRAAAALAVYSPGDVPVNRAALVHTETFFQAYWALTGLQVRNFHNARGEPKDPPPRPPIQQRPDKPLEMPRSTIKDRGKQVLFAIAAGVIFWILHGMAITGNSLTASGLWSDFLVLSRANFDLAWWQLTWLRDGTDALARLPVAVPHPFWMLLADAGFILCYGYLLASELARAFAQRAGLRNVNDAPPRLLNFLGLSGAGIVIADLAEDVFMLLALGADAMGWALAQDLCALAMSVASLLKWLWFVPAALLIARIGKGGTPPVPVASVNAPAAQEAAYHACASPRARGPGSR